MFRRSEQLVGKQIRVFFRRCYAPTGWMACTIPVKQMHMKVEGNIPEERLQALRHSWLTFTVDDFQGLRP
jgi:hypothetical protein